MAEKYNYSTVSFLNSSPTRLENYKYYPIEMLRGLMAGYKNLHYENHSKDHINLTSICNS